MLQLFRRPWLHFLILGLALFLVQRRLNPPPLPSVGPLPEAAVENLRRQWFSTTGRLPDTAELTRMVRAELDRDILFQEALELDIHLHDPIVRQRLVRNMNFLGLGEGQAEEELYLEALRMELHLGDEVVKRRLVQVMEQLLLARQPPARPTETEIQAAFEARRDELRLPPRYTIEQVFLDRARAEQAEALLNTIIEQALTPGQALEFSSPFLPGYRFEHQSPAQLARHFGSAFVLNFESLEPRVGQWAGPIQSTYGKHLVWLEALEAPRDPALDEVRDKIVRDLELEGTRTALAEAVARLRQDYEVRL